VIGQRGAGGDDWERARDLYNPEHSAAGQGTVSSKGLRSGRRSWMPLSAGMWLIFHPLTAPTRGPTE
jgi:hypothetical protein